MNAKANNAAGKPLLTVMVVGGMALAILATTGCDSVMEMQVVALAAEVAMFPDETLAIVGKIAGNHNETFLVGGAA